MIEKKKEKRETAETVTTYTEKNNRQRDRARETKRITAIQILSSQHDRDNHGWPG